MNDLVNVIAFITAKAGSEAQVEQALKIAEQESQAEAGCQSYVLTREIEAPYRYVMMECWGSLAALEAHKQGEAFQKLAAATADRVEIELIVTRSLG